MDTDEENEPLEILAEDLSSKGGSNKATLSLKEENGQSEGKHLKNGKSDPLESSDWPYEQSTITTRL